MVHSGTGCYTALMKTLFVTTMFLMCAAVLSSTENAFAKLQDWSGYPGPRPRVHSFDGTDRLQSVALVFESSLADGPLKPPIIDPPLVLAQGWGEAWNDPRPPIIDPPLFDGLTVPKPGPDIIDPPRVLVAGISGGGQLIAGALAVETLGVKSALIRQLIANAVDNEEVWTWAAGDDAEELGQIWWRSYSKEDGDPASYTFEVVNAPEDRDQDGRTDALNTLVSLPCGTEFDESELSGSCEVRVEKNVGLWEAVSTVCTCE